MAKEGKYAVLGNKIKTLREKQGISQQKLGRMAGIDPGNLSKIERGINPNPSYETILKLAIALEVEPVILLEKRVKPVLSTHPVSPLYYRIGRYFEVSIVSDETHREVYVGFYVKDERLEKVIRHIFALPRNFEIMGTPVTYGAEATYKLDVRMPALQAEREYLEWFWPDFMQEYMRDSLLELYPEPKWLSELSR